MGDFQERADVMAQIKESAIDHLFIADHVSFHDGFGMDGLINAATLAAMNPDITVFLGVYLLALRHPVPVARQLSTWSLSAPGRIIFGWGHGEARGSTKIRLDRAQQRVVLAMDEEPDFLTVDPEGHTLHKLDFNPGQPKWVRELEAGTLLGRIHAAHELAKKPTNKNIRLILDAWKRETFWGARQQFVSALASAKTAESVKALTHIVEEENDPMVIDHVMVRARGIQNSSLRSAVKKRLDRGLPYWAARNAWWGIGMDREEAPLERLEQAARGKGWSGIEAAGAIEGLAETRLPDAANILMDLARWGQSTHRNRGAALRALGRLGKFLERRDRERVAEYLVAALRDPHTSVQQAATDALATLKVVSAIPAIEAFAATLSHQESVAISRTVSTLRSPEDAKLAGLEKELEELRKASRKLEDRLAKLEDES